MTREEAIKTLKENYCAMCAYGSQDMDSCDIRSCDNKDAIKALEQEPKKGHWIRWYEIIEQEHCTIHDPHCKCSECNQEYEPYIASLFNYCPNCGAKMEGVQE